MLWVSFLLLGAFASACTQTVAGKTYSFQNLVSCDFYTPQFQYTFAFCEPSLACGGDTNVSVCQQQEGSTTQARLGTWDANATWDIGDDLTSTFQNGVLCGNLPTVVVTHYICQNQTFPKLRNVTESPPCQYNFFVAVPLKVCEALTVSPTTPTATTLSPTHFPSSSPSSAFLNTSAPTASPSLPTLSPTRSPTTFGTLTPTSAPSTHSPVTPSTAAPSLAPSTASPGVPTMAPTLATSSPTLPSLAPTSSAPSTVAPSTQMPTPTPLTQSPTTVAPSLVPTTSSPTTAAPSEAPSTLAPTTATPTTLSPSTQAPTSAAPTTLSPTTLNPTTLAPTTSMPTVSPTSAPTSYPTTSPTTSVPTTAFPTKSPTNAPTNAPTYSCSPTPEVSYPRRGYWSLNETSQPRKCAVYLACPGSCGESAEYPVQINADGSRVVSQCAWKEGFQGELCTGCSGEYYRGFGGACETCGSETEKLLHLIGVFVVSGAIFLGFGLSIIVFTERNLHWIGQIIVWIQMFVMLGALIASRLEKAWLVSIFDFLIVVNFGLESLQPGCKLFEHTNVLGYFWATILFNLTAIVLCILCSLLYGYHVSPQRLTQRGFTRQRAVLRRFGYALGLLLCMQYYQLAFRSASMLNCVAHDGLRPVLAIDPDVECYQGDHLVAAIVSWFLVFVLIAFPIWGFICLWRLRAQPSEETPSPLLFLTRGLKRPFVWFPLLEIFVNSLLIAQWAFTRSAAFLLLLALICFSLYVGLAGAAWIFIRNYDNILYISTRVVTMAVLLIGAGLFEFHGDFIIDSPPVFLTGAIVCGVSLCVLLAAQLVAVCGGRTDTNAFSQLAADESDLDALVSHVNVQYLAIDHNDEF